MLVDGGVNALLSADSSLSGQLAHDSSRSLSTCTQPFGTLPAHWSFIVNMIHGLNILIIMRGLLPELPILVDTLVTAKLALLSL